MADVPDDNSMESVSTATNQDVPGASTPEGFDVFVSYRIRPDEELASELKTLLESAMDPKPRVFVSGLGGLRASADGYREQLGAAARKAKAYVGIITKASIDREWIFFEAGAAFGRGVLYAPLLVDVSAGELPDSIGCYQGVLARDQARMQELTEDLARELGAQRKTRFGQRYARFAKTVENYGSKDSEEELSGVPQAIRLMERGRREEAEKLFDDLIDAAANPEKKADIRLTKLVFCCREGADLLELLEAQPNDVKTTSVGKLWLGVHETNPLKAVSLLREAWDGKLEGFDRRWALTSLATREFELGHKVMATKRLLEGLGSDDRHLRGDAAQRLATQVGEESPLGKLLLLVEATIDSSFERWHELSEYSWDKGYTALALHAASMCVGLKDNGLSRNGRGLARHQAALCSLAFEDYRAAARHGVPVAKSNMAALLNRGSVAEAGLEILRDHAGEFNCADPGHPYEIGMQLERVVAKERADEERLSEHGNRIIKAVHRLVATWLGAARACAQGSSSWRAMASGRNWSLTLDGDKVTVALDQKQLTVQRVDPLHGFYAALEGSTVRLLVVTGKEFEAVAIDGFATAGKLEWLQFSPSLP